MGVTKNYGTALVGGVIGIFIDGVLNYQIRSISNTWRLLSYPTLVSILLC